MHHNFVRAIIAAVVAACSTSLPASAGNEGNFVLYNHHTDEKGQTEINVFGDFSRVGRGSPNYTAQLLEIERAITDRLAMAFYAEFDKTTGGDADFAGWRLEGRYRLFDYGAFLNPVLYAEYENLRAEHKYILAVTGRTDATEKPGTKHEIETKLILGHDITDKSDIAFNWINEASADTGRWEFGYALGLNHELYESEGHEPIVGGGWSVKLVKAGAELYGGLGDSVLGLTLNPNVTAQYIGLNLKTEFANGAHIMLGAATGLTGQSEHALVRLMIGYEFK